ncbi:MarR family winged helix-turn-helix transcriptional regulator [Ornithinicoccus halotolerans]|uniref:MarR family winged helix-turn-helix transcriptional regulator n=1 Tax=Ornithinicoccus halotolerans TaxID=1748220 RepID=UPI001297AA43|nr:MarR family transcriptional regulator [Ornithinicoccus halotolerans]
MSDRERSKVLGGLLIAAADASRAAFAEAVSEQGFTPTQARALFALVEPMPMRSLADQMACDASNITGIADQLHALGLVQRVPGEDRRVKLLTLTAAGERRRAQLEQQVRDSTFPIDRLTTAEQDRLEELLRKLTGEATAPGATPRQPAATSRR